ncbi:unnamed protein product [Caenorhabditis sp. 36 PRJEB53466]|nr:unnamed protein product [Caenorhabditis sp. 36 PRJEB53466]
MRPILVLILSALIALNSAYSTPEMSARKAVRVAFAKCVGAVEPRSIVQEAIRVSADRISIGNSHFPRSNATKIVLLGFGKAVLLMGRGAGDRLTAPLLQKTFLIAPSEQKPKSPENSTRIREIWYGGRNNLPDAKSVSATTSMLSEIDRLDSPDTIFVFLISGGGSALFCSPRRNLVVEDKVKTIKAMQAAGATIQQLNTVRQNISEVKGGKVLRRIRHGQSVSLIISDVIGDPIDLIAGGPTAIPTQSEGSVEHILKDLGVGQRELGSVVWSALKQKEKDTSPIRKDHFANHIIASNRIALRAAYESLTSAGFHTSIITSSLSGNAAEIGRQFADLIASESFDSPLLKNASANLQYPIALLFGGETTVKLAAHPGKGGRNQEMVLACFDALKSQTPAHQFVFLSAGSDGQDGPTDAAGAIITNSDLLVPSPTSSASLAASDSYNFWKHFNNGKSHLITGPSGTNVMDIQILVLNKL